MEKRGKKREKREEEVEREKERGVRRDDAARTKRRKGKKIGKLKHLFFVLTWNCITRSLKTGPNSFAQPVMIRWRSFSQSLGRIPTRPVEEVESLIEFFFSSFSESPLFGASCLLMAHQFKRLLPFFFPPRLFSALLPYAGPGSLARALERRETAIHSLFFWWSVERDFVFD